LESAAIKMSAHHPFRSEKAKERYLKLYDIRAKEWPVASETRMAPTAYGHTFVRVSGPAITPPLVLLHGVSGASLQWMPNIGALSKSFRVYAVDNIYDYGRSVYTRIIKSPDDYVVWLDELFDALALRDKIHLMGLSYGGWLASQYALRFPQRLDKMVLLAPVGTVLPLRAEWILRALLCALPHPYFTKRFMYWLLEDLVHKDAASRRMVDEWVEESHIALRSFKPKRMAHPTILTDVELRHIKAPTLYLVGENEKLYSAQKAVERLRKAAPQIEAEVIPKAGHDLTFVQAELVNRKVVDFLERPYRLTTPSVIGGV
jgi:pimeloyl-ACP methyl ester carboxylesterase